MYEYIKLLDEINYGMIIKAEGRKQYRFIFGLNEWKRTGILLEYYTEESDKYEKLIEVSEEEAYIYIERQKIEYEMLLKSIKEKASNIYGEKQYLYDFVCKYDYFEEIETSIAALLYYIKINHMSYDVGNDIKEKSILKRIYKSVNILFQNVDLSNEKQLINLRIDNNAGEIKKLEIKEWLKKPDKKEELYKKALIFLGN